MDANIVTVVPEWPAYGWYFAQAPVSVGADPFPPVELFPQAASAVRATMAGASSMRLPRAERAIMVGPPTKRSINPPVVPRPHGWSVRPVRGPSLPGAVPCVNVTEPRTGRAGAPTAVARFETGSGGAVASGFAERPADHT